MSHYVARAAVVFVCDTWSSLDQSFATSALVTFGLDNPVVGDSLQDV